MAIIRIKHSDFETKYRVPECADTLNIQEWAAEDANRVKEAGWDSRYDYEANLIAGLSWGNRIPTILELGSGPGVLCEKIQNILAASNVEAKYDLVDKPFAKKAFEKANRKGRFFVKDISYRLDTAFLENKYDLVIANDVLEHLFNPSDVIQKIHTLLVPSGLFFISVPNWRMGHQFIYRGLFDYDNFLYFMMVHGFDAQSVSPSILQTPDYARLDSEQEMPEELRLSWNWYFTFIPNNKLQP